MDLIAEVDKRYHAMPCGEYERALAHLRDAQRWLNERELRRMLLRIEDPAVNHDNRVALDPAFRSQHDRDL